MKYQLKQWYPSLPNELSEGDIVTENESGYAKIRNKYYHISAWTIDKKEVENNSEYWKHIEDKQYEILSFKYCGSIYKKGKRDSFWKNSSGIGYKEWSLLDNLNPDIHSVKRLSDGEVFTIGDRIKLSTGSVIKIGHIDFPSREDTKKKIYLHNRKRTKDEPYTKNGEINNVELINEPLFTTEDGTDLYEGDKFYIVTENFKLFTSHAGNQELPTGYYFSDEEKAKEYIDKHKPKYSKHDIGKAITKTLNFNRDHIIDEFLDNLYE